MIAREHKKLDRVRDAYESGVYTLDEFKNSRQKIIDRIAELIQRQNIPSAPDENEQKKIIKSKVVSLLPALRSPAVSESDKNTMLKSVVERVVFYRSSGSIDVFFYA